MKKYLVLTLLLYVCASSALSGQSSRVVTDSLYSEILQCSRPYNVYLPKNYAADESKEYPVLYLLHGLWGNERNWSQRGHLRDVMMISCSM